MSFGLFVLSLWCRMDRTWYQASPTSRLVETLLSQLKQPRRLRIMYGTRRDLQLTRSRVQNRLTKAGVPAHLESFVIEVISQSILEGSKTPPLLPSQIHRRTIYTPTQKKTYEVHHKANNLCTYHRFNMKEIDITQKSNLAIQ